MNGKKAKHLRRSAAFVVDHPISYIPKYHTKKGMFPILNDKGEVTGEEEKSYTILQVLLGNCTRRFYQLMKRKPRKNYEA